MRSTLLRLASALILICGIQNAANAAISFNIVAHHDNHHPHNNRHGYDNRHNNNKLRFEIQQLYRQAREEMQRAEFHNREAQRFAHMGQYKLADKEARNARKAMKNHDRLMQRAAKLEHKAANHHHWR